jgi:acyl dehydratase
MSIVDNRRQLWWEEVSVGDAVDGFSLRLDCTTMVLSVSGSQDFNRVHHDVDFARESGHTGVFYNTGWTTAMLARAITDWMGPQGWLAELDFTMRQMNMQGDNVRVRGEVTGKRVDAAGRHVIEMKVWLENDRVGVATPGTALVLLPVRQGAFSG